MEVVAMSGIILLLGVDELAAIDNAEVVDFRKHMHDFCEHIAQKRDSQVGCKSLVYLDLYLDHQSCKV